MEKTESSHETKIRGSTYKVVLESAENANAVNIFTRGYDDKSVAQSAKDEKKDVQEK